MEKKIFSQKLLLLIIALFLMGLFVWYVWTYELDGIIPSNPEPNVKVDESLLPDSAIYNRDLTLGIMDPDKGGTWQNQTFTRYIIDFISKDSKIGKCFYYIYDKGMKIFSAVGERKCSDDFKIRVGNGAVCSSQGEGACMLYVYAENENGNEGNTTMASYNIDFEAPVVGKVFTKENESYPIKAGKGEKKTYMAEVSDGLNVEYCWFFFDGNSVFAPISPSPCENGEKCVVSAEYAFDEGETHNVFVRCADHYLTETEKYLNAKNGETAQISVSINHSPTSSCRVSPTQGNVSASFNFEVKAEDQDGDTLSFSWDFGDGSYSGEESPTHNYKNKGTYEPKVTVSDGKGLQVVCSTAWVSVSE